MRGTRRFFALDKSVLRFFILAGCFFLGILSGHFLVGKLPSDQLLDIQLYFQEYLRYSAQREILPNVFFATLWLYGRYPLIAFVLGFTLLGCVMLPACAAVFGFFLSFSICCLTAVFGSQGVILSLLLFGLRCLISLPCFLLVSSLAWQHSAELLSLSLGRGRGTGRTGGGRNRKLVLFAFITLFLGGCLDTCLAPWLLRLAADWGLFL